MGAIEKGEPGVGERAGSVNVTFSIRMQNKRKQFLSQAEHRLKHTQQATQRHLDRHQQLSQQARLEQNERQRAQQWSFRRRADRKTAANAINASLILVSLSQLTVLPYALGGQTASAQNVSLRLDANEAIMDSIVRPIGHLDHRHKHDPHRVLSLETAIAPNNGTLTGMSLSSALLRAFMRTNNMRAYHLDLHSYRPEAKFVGDPEFVDSKSSAHLKRCRAHLSYYDDLLRAYLRTDPMELMDHPFAMESIRLADTFGRPDAGLLDGNQFWLGSYERCAGLGVHLAAGEIVTSQYCLGVAQFPSWKPEDTKNSIKIGLCLPETCTSSMLNEAADLFELTETMMKYQLGGPNQPLDKLRLRSVYCLPHDTSLNRQMSLSGKLLIGLMSLLVVACLYATLHDYLNRKANRLTTQAAATANKEPCDGNGEIVVAPRNWRLICVESFSLIRNWEKIFSPPPREHKRQEQPTNELGSRFNRSLFFDSITGIKCIGLLWIIGAHTFLVSPITSKNLISFDTLTKTYLANLFLAAHLMVDSFFALAGLLASYLLFKSQELANMRLKHWVALTIHRYWRLTPVYLLCYWFAKSLGHLANSGPLWDYSTAAQSPRLNCANESWWQAILYLSDFKSPKAHCVPFAWFIANGIKFWIVTPLFLTLIHKSLKRGYALLMAAIILNIALVVRLAINSNVDMKSVIEFKPESADNMLNNMEEVYTRPYSRIGAYLVGLMAGHLIYLFDEQRQPLRMSEKMKILIWSLVSATAIVLTFVIKIAGGVELEESIIPWVFSFSSALIRPLWALCTCWLVFALAHGQARYLASFLSAPVWRYLAKLSFCAYLVQGEVIANLYLSSSFSGPYSYTDMVTRPIVATVITIALSLIMALVVEYPLIGIEELILPARRHKAPSSAGTKVFTATETVVDNEVRKRSVAEVVATGHHHLNGEVAGGKLLRETSNVDDINDSKLKEL